MFLMYKRLPFEALYSFFRQPARRKEKHTVCALVQIGCDPYEYQMAAKGRPEPVIIIVE